MEKMDAVAALSALAQDNRLDVFRLLVQAGPGGMPAGAVATALGLAPNTLTFHFDRLRQAGLVTVRRDGRSMIYAARYETMNALLAFLTDNCCGGAPEQCAPAQACQPATGCKTVEAKSPLNGPRNRLQKSPHKSVRTKRTGASA
jgi:ArsR family transcriptional regulator, arsenate/arsenite/antimonite-responsive transcriptional repressor